MPDFLTPAQAQLRESAEELAQSLLELSAAPHTATAVTSNTDNAAASESNPHTADLYKTVLAASKACGIWELTQQELNTPDGRSSPKGVSPKGTSPAATPALDLVIVRDTLASHNVVHLPGIFGPSPTLLAAATEPLRSQMLPPYLAGELRGSFGFTEPADAERPTWALRDGDELVINGQKSYVTGGADADFVNTLVEVEGSGASMVFIETDRSGVEMIRRFGTLDGSHHAAFVFKNVRVPASHVLGSPGEGLKRSLSQISGIRMDLAARSAGLGRFIIALTEELLQHIATNASALSSAAPRIQLGEMRTLAYAVRSTVYRTARLIDTGENAVNEVMAAKAFATETVGRLCDKAIQVLGGQALADSHPLNAILRRVRSWRLAEGTTEVLYSNIARGILDLDLGRI